MEKSECNSCNIFFIMSANFSHIDFIAVTLLKKRLFV